MAFYSHVVGKHLHDHIILLRRKVLAHITSLTLPLFIGVPIPRQENERMPIYMAGVSILPLSAIFLQGFGTVLTDWYSQFFILIELLLHIVYQENCSQQLTFLVFLQAKRMWFDVITVMEVYVTGNLVMSLGKNMPDGFLSANMSSK